MRMRLRSDLCMIGRESDNTLAATTIAREKEVSLHHRPSELPRQEAGRVLNARLMGAQKSIVTASILQFSPEKLYNSVLPKGLSFGATVNYSLKPHRLDCPF